MYKLNTTLNFLQRKNFMQTPTPNTIIFFKKKFELYFITLKHKNIKENKKVIYKFKIFVINPSCKK